MLDEVGRICIGLHYYQAKGGALFFIVRCPVFLKMRKKD